MLEANLLSCKKVCESLANVVRLLHQTCITTNFSSTLNAMQLEPINAHTHRNIHIELSLISRSFRLHRSSYSLWSGRCILGSNGLIFTLLSGRTLPFQGVLFPCRSGRRGWRGFIKHRVIGDDFLHILNPCSVA